MSDCVFCMIRDGDIPARKVYEDENVFAILDMSQVTPGHTLLIPKKHVRNIFDYDEELA
ncbi:MAG TPA: HIT family protein, partial [Atopostipes sp.]|nr:HIT family protein [Atopostipes sp.]